MRNLLKIFLYDQIPKLFLARFLLRGLPRNPLSKKPGFPLQVLGKRQCASCGLSATIPRARTSGQQRNRIRDFASVLLPERSSGYRPTAFSSFGTGSADYTTA
jgi:hypothetical protein